MVATERLAQLDAVQGCQSLFGSNTVPQRGLDSNDLACDTRRNMGNAVGIGFNLAGCTDDTGQTLLFSRGNSHAVLLLHLCGHLDLAFFAVYVVAFLLLLVFIMFTRLFILVAGFFLFGMFRATAFALGSAIVNAAAQGDCQDKSDDDSFLVHCTPPLSSVATADSSLTRAV